MIVNASEFVFYPPAPISRARRVLIKPDASSYYPQPLIAGKKTLERIISGIREVSDADILLLEGSPQEKPIRDVYKALGYDFPRVLIVDVKDCNLVEVENPLAHPYAIPTFWVPNIILACDYLISVSSFRIYGNSGSFTIRNLLGLLPLSKYKGSSQAGPGELYKLGIDRVIADLYFTLPFDLGIIDGRKKFTAEEGSEKGEIEDYNRIFIGEPYEVDLEASNLEGLEPEYLRLIEMGRVEINY